MATPGPAGRESLNLMAPSQSGKYLQTFVPESRYSTVHLQTESMSSAGVPMQTVLPWSMMAVLSQSSSASSM